MPSPDRLGNAGANAHFYGGSPMILSLASNLAGNPRSPHRPGSLKTPEATAGSPPGRRRRTAFLSPALPVVLDHGEQHRRVLFPFEAVQHVWHDQEILRLALDFIHSRDLIPRDEKYDEGIVKDIAREILPLPGTNRSSTAWAACPRPGTR